jgi:D-alanine-D-alanine ligase
MDQETGMFLRALLTQVDDHADILHQILVVNTKQSYSLPDDYSKFSVTTEYLSDVELDQLLQGFRDGGLVTDLYVGELSFIRALTSGLAAAGSKNIPLVYSTVPSGTWHGRDSLVPALCGAFKVSYCGSNAYAMGVSGNKYYALRLAEHCGENTGGISLFSSGGGWGNTTPPPPGTKVIIKPALECASIGVDVDSVCEVDDNLEETLAERAALLRQPLLVQPFVAGYEIEVPIYGVPEPVAPAAYGIAVNGEKNLGDRFLTYDRIYHGEYSFYRLKDENPELDLELRASASRIFRELALHGFGRVDYRVRADGTWAVTDINAVPHLTPDASTSLAFGAYGFAYPDVLKLVTAAGLLAVLPIKGGTSTEYR